MQRACTQLSSLFASIGQNSRRSGYQLSLPIHPDLARLLTAAPSHSAMTIAATTAGTPFPGTDLSRTAPHRWHSSRRSRLRYRHGPAVARPKNVGDGDSLFRDGRHGWPDERVLARLILWGAKREQNCLTCLKKCLTRRVIE